MAAWVSGGTSLSTTPRIVGSMTKQCLPVTRERRAQWSGREPVTVPTGCAPAACTGRTVRRQLTATTATIGLSAGWSVPKNTIRTKFDG